MVTIEQQEEIQYLERLFKRYVYNSGETESAGSRNRRAHSRNSNRRRKLLDRKT